MFDTADDRLPGNDRDRQLTDRRRGYRAELARSDREPWCIPDRRRDEKADASAG